MVMFSRCGGSGRTPKDREGLSEETATCPDCAGTGQVKLITASIVCNQCDGKGLAEVETERYVSGMVKKETIVCPRCNGSGQAIGPTWVPDL